MARRRQATEPQQLEQLRPQAQPTDTFYRPTNGAPQVTINDFAPLSNTVQSYLRDKARTEGAESAQAGDKFVQENSLLVQDMESDASKIKDPKERSTWLQSQFDWLQKKGMLKAAADPYFQIGYARSAARLMVGSYRDKVFARMGEVSTTTDPKTGLPAQPADPERIMAEEWSQVKDSPALLNFYGSQEALAFKGQVDDDFRSKSSGQRADAIEKEYRGQLQRELGQQFDVLLHANSEINSETLQPMTDFLTNEVRGHNVQNPRELVLEGLELSFQRAAAADPDEAVRGVYAAEELVVGGVKLGDDRGGVGQRLESLKREYIQRAKEQTSRDVQDEENKRRKAVQKAEDVFVPMLVRAKQEGQPLTSIVRDLSDQFLKDDDEKRAYDGFGGFAVEALQDFALKFDSRRQSDQTLMSRVDTLVADGDVNSAETLLQSGLSTGDVTGEDYAKGKQMLSQRRDVSEYVENNGLYNAVKARYDQVKPSGYSEEIQRKLDDESVEQKRKLERDFAEYVRSTVGAPNREELHRRWLGEREAADSAVTRERSDTISGGRDELVSETRKKFQRHQDASEQIESGLRSGLLTKIEAQGLREDNEKAADREPFYRLPEYRDAEAWIEEQIQSELVGGGGKPGLDELQIRQEAYQKLRDSYDGALDEVFADEKVSPRNFTMRARVALRNIQDELSDQLFPSSRKTVESGVQAGKAGSEIQANVQHLSDDFDLAQKWAAQLETTDGRENLSPKSPLFRRANGVPESFYKDASLWLSGIDPWFGSPVSRAQMVERAQQTAVTIVSNPRLSPKEMQDAGGAIVETIGITPSEVLNDLAEFRADPAQRAKSEARLKELEGFAKWSSATLLEESSIPEEMARLKLQLAGGATIEMKGYTYRPFSTPFFKTEAEFEEFSKSAQWDPFLKRIGIEPGDAKSVKDFGVSQLDNIRRVNL